MAELTRLFRETVDAALERDPEFAKAYVAELRTQAARVEALEKALESSEELFRALIDINQPHRALATWGRKWSVHVGYARASYAERKLRAISGELARLEAARKLLEGKLAESVASEDELKDPANWGLDEKGQL